MSNLKNDKNFTEGCKAIAQRIVNAETRFVDVITAISGCTQEQALKVLAVYKKHKVAKLNVSQGVYDFKHGVYLEKDVILNAINM